MPPMDGRMNERTNEMNGEMELIWGGRRAHRKRRRGRRIQWAKTCRKAQKYWMGFLWGGGKAAAEQIPQGVKYGDG